MCLGHHVPVIINIVAEEQDVRPGLNGQSDGVGLSVELCHGLHGHVVGYHHALIAELFAQDAGDNLV